MTTSLGTGGTVTGRTIMQTVWIAGEPRPKGSLAPRGNRYGKGPVRLQESVAGSKDWLTHQYNELQRHVRVTCNHMHAGETAQTRRLHEQRCSGFRLPAGLPHVGAVAVHAVWLVDKLPRRTDDAGAFPMVMSHGDLDKLQRSLGDALQMAGIIKDDRMVTRWVDPRKRFWERVHPNVAGRWGITGPGVLVKVTEDWE